MTFKEWYAKTGSRFMSSETAMRSAWDAAVVNSKFTPEGYVLVPVDAAIELLKAVYGNPETMLIVNQTTQEMSDAD